jgi:hypothetical protein
VHVNICNIYIYIHFYIHISHIYIYVYYIHISYIYTHIDIHMYDRHQQPQRLRGASGLLMLGDGSQVGSTRNSNRLRSTSSGQRYSFRVKSWLLLRSLSNKSAVPRPICVINMHIVSDSTVSCWLQKGARATSSLHPRAASHRESHNSWSSFGPTNGWSLFGCFCYKKIWKASILGHW